MVWKRIRSRVYPLKAYPLRVQKDIRVPVGLASIYATGTYGSLDFFCVGYRI